MINRVREFFNSLPLNNSQIARMLGVTPQYIYKIMNLDIEPSERIILAIEKAFPDLNTVWLETGKGEMYTPKTRQMELDDMNKKLKDAADSMPDDANAVFLYNLMKVMSQMTPEQIEMLRDITEKFTDLLKSSQIDLLAKYINDDLKDIDVKESAWEDVIPEHDERAI